MSLYDATSWSSRDEGDYLFDVLCASSPVGCLTQTWTLVSLLSLYIWMFLVSPLFFLFFRFCSFVFCVFHYWILCSVRQNKLGRLSPITEIGPYEDQATVGPFSWAISRLCRPGHLSPHCHSADVTHVGKKRKTLPQRDAHTIKCWKLRAVQ